MPVRPVVIYPDPRLREKALDVLVPSSIQVTSLVEDLIETMYAKSGIGIAAPQLGVAAKVFIVDLEAFDKSDFVYFNSSSSIEYKPLAFINPTVVIEGKEKTFEMEGCLSFPGIALEIERASQATLRAVDGKGNEFEICGRGYLARCMLHEFDHLTGKVFVDYVGHTKRQMVGKKLKRGR